LPDIETMKRRFRLEYTRMRRRLLRECDAAGASREVPLRAFDETAGAVERDVATSRADDEPEHVTRQRMRHALRAALGAGRDAMRPDEVSAHVPRNGDRPMLEDVLIGVDSVVVLLEHEVFRPRFTARMRLGDGADDESVHRWRGCDVRIAEAPYPSYAGSSILVVTEHAAALAGLFHDLADVARPAIDFRSKYEFFGRMAEAANAWLARHPESDRGDLLIVAAREARAVVENWLARVEDSQPVG